MRMRLISLCLLLPVLILAISSCGGDAEDFKPVNKTGALDGSAPDVILFVMGSPIVGNGAGQRHSTDLGPRGKGVAFSAAYSRYTDAHDAFDDLLGMGQTVETQSERVEDQDSPLLQAMTRGGYTTSVLDNAHLEAYLAEKSVGPRFALVETWSMADWLECERAVRAKESETGQGILTVWTAMPAANGSEALTEAQLHIPLVFSMPGTMAEKQVHTQVVSLADVGVTLLDLCGLIPEGTEFNDNEGASFARILQKKPLAWRGFVLAKTPSGAGWIRSTRWKLTRQADGKEVLTYIEKEPSSTRDDSNLAGAPAQREGLGGRLDVWLQ